jgi:hypothetical protein
MSVKIYRNQDINTHNRKKLIQYSARVNSQTSLTYTVKPEHFPRGPLAFKYLLCDVRGHPTGFYTIKIAYAYWHVEKFKITNNNNNIIIIIIIEGDRRRHEAVPCHKFFFWRLVTASPCKLGTGSRTRVLLILSFISLRGRGCGAYQYGTTCFGLLSGC